MALQYSCANEQRRAQVNTFNATTTSGTTIQAIDYVEVVDTRDGVPEEAAQYTLLVYGLVDWQSTGTPTAEQITIAGGTRITEVEVAYVERLDAIIASPPSDVFHTDELAYVVGLGANPKILVVRVTERGDFSTYTLTITAFPSGAPYLRDPILSTVEFSFKAGCPTSLDCETEDEPCAESTEPTPAIDYLSRDFNSFRQVMLDRLAVVLPEWWQEESPADIGNTLVDLVAHVADQIAYHQDAVATEAYLSTARKRVSVRRHARLLDYPMHDGCNARAWLAVEVDDTASAAVTVPSGTVFLTRVAGYERPMSESQYTEAILTNPVVFESMHEGTLWNEWNAIELYTWYDSTCCLPTGATQATVRLAASSTAAPTVGQVWILEEVVNPDDAADAADASHRQAVRLLEVEEVDEPLDDGSWRYFNVTWHEEDALTFAARLGDGSNYVFRGNVILVDHGLTRPEEELTPVAVTASRYRPRLPDTDVTFRVEYDHEAAQAISAANTLEQDVTEALPDVTLVEADGDTWSPQRTLLASDAFAREFVVETEEDGRAWIRFGDGSFGAEPTEGHTLEVTWRQGNGVAGNVGAEAIYHVVSTALGRISSLRNPLPAAGGTDPEPLADVRRFAPQAFRTQRRAVTLEDYETILAHHPEVQRAKASMRWTGSWKTVYLAVDRKGTSEVDDAFLEEIAAYLETYRMMGVDLEMRAPRTIGLDLRLTVCVDERYARSQVLAALRRAFSARDNADGTRGMFHPDNFSFGDSLYLSQLVATAMGVDGVQRAFTTVTDELLERFESEDTCLRFRRFAGSDGSELDAGVITMGTFEILRVDNDRSNPERGVIDFNLLGGR